MEEFVSADISKITKFESESVEAIAEFNSIRDRFEAVNSALLDKWKGAGAEAYRTETDHILTNIGDIGSILDRINNSAVRDIKDNYLELDNALGEFNRNPQSGESDEG